MDELGIRFPALVTRVIDGDTIEVSINRTIRIRLLDCWAPETRTTDDAEKALGIAALNYLTLLAISRECVVDVPIEGAAKFGDSMTFGRVLGHVSVDGVDLAEQMVRSGHAHATRER